MKALRAYPLAVFAALWALAEPLSIGAQTFQELYAFGGGSDGVYPQGALSQGRDGNFYGTTTGGGGWGAGTVFRMTPDGTLTTLASFDGTNGADPIGALVQANDGNFYGATGNDGLFKATADGTLTNLFTFGGVSAGADGSGLLGDLVQATDGNIYGTTQDPGTVFRLVPNGTSWQVQTLFSFFRDTNGNYPYGLGPSGGVVQAGDGNLYGATYEGGPDGGSGVVYQMTLGGTATVMGTFHPGSGRAEYPFGRLVQASDGNLYGTAGGCGSQCGSIFKVTLGGVLTTVAWGIEEPNGGLVEAN